MSLRQCCPRLIGVGRRKGARHVALAALGVLSGSVVLLATPRISWVPLSQKLAPMARSSTRGELGLDVIKGFGVPRHLVDYLGEGTGERMDELGHGTVIFHLLLGGLQVHQQLDKDADLVVELNSKLIDFLV